MIARIVTSGQVGVEQAAIEAAGRLELPCAGQPAGWEAEKGPMAADQWAAAVEGNALAADGTLLFRTTKLPDFFRVIQRKIVASADAWLEIDLKQIAGFRAAEKISGWIAAKKIRVLHVSGSAESENSSLQRSVADVLEAVTYLLMMTESPSGFSRTPRLQAAERRDLPTTVAAAVDHLDRHLPLKDRVLIANMTEKELPGLHLALGDYIKETFGLYVGNDDLMTACRFYLRKASVSPDEASLAILRALWLKLQQTMRLRVVK
ncbi:MAG: putative molybdenum carrier protein [Desulfobacteraceae bacterium]|jgi:hypothetical protein|nr:putative molybdenum carrier protein [Desulfobacteraceae bacterium]